jgi:hypothetical protein
LAGYDELLLDRLSALVQEIDPVPASVMAASRAVFAQLKPPRYVGSVEPAGDPTPAWRFED